MPDTMVGTWSYEATSGNNAGRIQFDGSGRFVIETDGQSETYGYSYDSENGLLSLSIPSEEALCYAKLIGESKIMLYTDSNVVWMDSDNGYEFDTEFYYFTLSGIVFDADDIWLLTRTDDTALQAVNETDATYSKLISGFWTSDGFRLSDTEIYRFERGELDSSSGNINGQYYWDYGSAPNGSWREAQNYTLNGNVLNLYFGNEVSDTLDYDATSSQFISRMRKQLVEQERMENGVYIPAQTQPYSLSKQSDDPRS